jgi:bacteriorhodopsin
MVDQTIDFLSEYFWIVVAAASACVVFISSVADRRRHRRKRIEDVGFMPWTGITVFSLLATLLSIALAIKSR